MRERIAHRFLQCAPWILLDVRCLVIGLVEQRDHLAVEELRKSPRLIDQRPGDLRPCRDRIGSIDSGIDGVDRERAWDEALRLYTEQ